MVSTTEMFRGLVVMREQYETIVCSLCGEEVVELTVTSLHRTDVKVSIKATPDVRIRRVKSLAEPIEFPERKSSGGGNLCLTLKIGVSVHFKVDESEPFYIGLIESRSGKARFVCNGTADVHFRRGELDARDR